MTGPAKAPAGKVPSPTAPASGRRPMRDLAQSLTLLRDAGFMPGTVIDVGFCFGTPDLTGTFRDAYHILFEPMAEREPLMNRVLTRHRGEAHVMALGSQAGTFAMRVVPTAPEGASLATAPKTPEALARASAAGHEVRQVPVGTLDGMFGGRDLERPILLKTDCQGFDLEVMKGGVGFLKRVDLAVMEVNMFHPAGDRSLADFGTTVAWMRDRGFSVHDIVSYQVRPRDQALGYVDLVFARDDGPLRAHHSWV